MLVDLPYGMAKRTSGKKVPFVYSSRYLPGTSKVYQHQAVTVQYSVSDQCQDCIYSPPPHPASQLHIVLHIHMSHLRSAPQLPYVVNGSRQLYGSKDSSGTSAALLP